MKEVMMMMLPDCPYCHQADRLLAELAAEDEETSWDVEPAGSGLTWGLRTRQA